MVERRLIAVEGVVQGVGFRPYVHRLAAVNNLSGFVRNDAGGVQIDVQGEHIHVDAFCRALVASPPPLAVISGVRVETASPRPYGAFRILESGAPARKPVPPLVPPDVATCDACLLELFDPQNRRYEHPFITCTDCGPRFTIIRNTPYDRERTTMADFAMCVECRREYEDPTDRRFHAETIACWSCGPTLRAHMRGEVPVGTGADAIDLAVRTLRDSGIVALKSLGGYHLACDATAPAAVGQLRERKRREAKPLAVMVRDAARAAELCLMSAAERVLLESPAKPIVLLERRASAHVALEVAPGQGMLGVMLPSTPVHHLLLAALDRPLVMTSGNRSDEPVAIDEEGAFAALAPIADLFLVHDRPIAARCDDSVLRVAAGDAQPVRRSRGYAPRTITFARPSPCPVLATGGHHKNTACLASGSRATLSAHVGELDSAESRQALGDAIAGLMRATHVSPTVIAHDLHAEYGSTHVAHTVAAELGVDRLVAVQHHHAHVAACVAEHAVTAPVIGVVFDGAGLGTDDAIWGGEFLLVNGAAFERCGHLAYVPLPGGDAAAKRPWRSAAAHLASGGGGAQPRDVGGLTVPTGVAATEWRLVHALLARPDQLPRTSSVGRLFDAVASLLELCHVSRFEGEAPMAVEAAADPRATGGYDAPISGDAPWTVDASALVRHVVADRRRGRPVTEIAGAFHLGLRDIVVAGCDRVREQTDCGIVALTGGVFVNALLLTLTHAALSARGFRVLVPRLVPCNDGGLSLGQAYVAARAVEENPCA